MATLFSLFLIVSIGAIAAPVKDPLKDFFKNKTKIDKPLELRDPFRPPLTKSETEKKQKESGFYNVAKGMYTNIEDKAVASVEEIRVVGVLIGKERRAMVTAGEKGPVVILKEGMKIGQDGAELKAILPGGIILVEKIVNVYGQEEFLETVIPISR